MKNKPKRTWIWISVMLAAVLMAPAGVASGQDEKADKKTPPPAETAEKDEEFEDVGGGTTTTKPPRANPKPQR